jgi:hypothetical protein
MALAGNIKEFGLADIFQIVSLQQKTGELIVEGTDGKATILLEKGYIVGADATFRPIEERLRQSLIRSQSINKFQLKRATEAQKKTLQPLWAVLAETKAVDSNVLQSMLSQQIHETVYHVLRWTDGEYRFDPKKSVEYDRRLIKPINSEFLVMEGFRITDEWSEIEKEIPSFQLVIRRTSDHDGAPDNLNEAESKIYNLLTKEQTIQDLIDSSRLGEFDTCQTIYHLMQKDLVQKVQSKTGKLPKVRRISFGVTDLLVKVLTVVVAIAVLVGIVIAFQYLPEDFVLIHKPRFGEESGSFKRYVAQSQLNDLSRFIPLYFLKKDRTLPTSTSLEAFKDEGFIASDQSIIDPWGRQYMMSTEPTQVILRSLGQDGTPNTDDDITLTIPL